MTRIRSERWVLVGVVTPLVLAIVMLVALCVVGFSMLSAARAYVSGESLWSKARANAVAQLRSHALSGNASDYRRFEEALSVPLGDRAARLEMDKVRPDRRVIEAGFLAGEIAPEDVRGMVVLYRYFRHADFMEEAVAAWTEGDRLIDQLHQLGQRIHGRVAQGEPPASFTRLLIDLDAIDAQLMAVEKYFSATLGRASRTTETWLAHVTAAFAALLAVGGTLLARRQLHIHFADRQLLMDANQRWDMAARAADIGLFDWHLSEDRIELDARAASLLMVGTGAAGASITRAQLKALTHPEDHALLRDKLEQLSRNDALFRMRLRITPPDGTLRHLEWMGRARGIDGPATLRLVGIVRDIGGEVAQAKLALDKESAERVARLRIEFLSRLSHELRTPLNAVLGVAQLLRIDPLEPLSINQAKRVQMLQDSGTQLLRLVEDVLDITRIDSGQMVIQCAPTDLVAVVRTSMHMVEPERAAFDVQVDDRLPRHAVMVHADAQRLQQVFVNLLSNGCKYNARGGTLMLACHGDERRVSVAITDQGRGLTIEQAGQLFQPFKRFATSEVPGTGLGLVVTRLLLERMNGSIAVQSEPGRGCCFTVTLQRT